MHFNKLLLKKKKTQPNIKTRQKESPLRHQKEQQHQQNKPINTKRKKEVTRRTKMGKKSRKWGSNKFCED
jgi:hypothetical protein